MLADGDSAARNAFCEALRGDASASSLANVANVNPTQELDPADILEVRDMAEAIARADRLVPPASSQPIDMFDSLGRRPTVGRGRPARDGSLPPATLLVPLAALDPLEVRISLPAEPETVRLGEASPSSPPALPRPHAVIADIGLSSLPSSARAPASVPRAPSAPAQLAPAAVDADDAYFHPGGRIRSLADVTLEGMRADATLLLRAARRRSRVSVLLAAAFLPLTGLAAFAAFTAFSAGSSRDRIGGTETTSARSSLSSLQKSPTVAVNAAPTIAAAAPASTAKTTATTTAAPFQPTSSALATGTSIVPVLDVNSLPSAGSRRASTARR